LKFVSGETRGHNISYCVEGGLFGVPARTKKAVNLEAVVLRSRVKGSRCRRLKVYELNAVYSKAEEEEEEI
jgi:hypothetical protein